MRDFNPDRLNDIIDLLRNRARQRGTISYPELHKCYGDDRKHQLYWTLEEAAERLARREICIYDALMRSKSGLPLIGFFEVYKNSRSAEYRAMVGHTDEQDLTLEQQRLLTEHMRELVYRHAASN